MASLDVKKLAELARLEVTDAEAAALERDLSKILEYAARVTDLDTEGVPPTTHPLETHADVLRDDVPRRGLSREEALAAASEVEDGTFRVPRIVG